MRIVNISFAVLFILFALLQYNDPDPYLWIPIYGYAAIVCILNARNKYDRFAHIAGIIFCIGFGVKQLFTRDGVLDWIRRYDTENLVQSMKATKPWIENTREFGGLMIILLVLLTNIILHKKARIFLNQDRKKYIEKYNKIKIMNRAQVNLTVIGFILLALMATNPSIEDHREGVKKMYKEKLETINKQEKGDLGTQIGTDIASLIGDGFINKIVSRENYLVFSFTKISFGNKSKKIGIGIMGQVFIQDYEDIKTSISNNTLDIDSKNNQPNN